jgi:hypothetical protein
MTRIVPFVELKVNGPVLRNCSCNTRILNLVLVLHEQFLSLLSTLAHFAKHAVTHAGRSVIII